MRTLLGMHLPLVTVYRSFTAGCFNEQFGKMFSVDFNFCSVMTAILIPHKVKVIKSHVIPVVDICEHRKYGAHDRQLKNTLTAVLFHIRPLTGKLLSNS
jgi:hypothetical protein